ncbi:hypothetical protein [Methylicorpusculum sp.]|uniref:hypothetical protein n=1 Tax=Methylicorpusculum sp. TaxID=2713644 RepID=UPI00271B4DEE|nr:hypothetical protein [Methylicorpusculum sp.]MDO8845577.1 hypothetical protein [Methylicorpusculum sp.]
MFKIIKAGGILICTASLLSGCGISWIANRDTNPIIQDWSVAPHILPWNSTMLNTFSTTASRRMVLAKYEATGDTLLTCAEPPPDVGEAFASAVANTLTAKAPIEGVPVEVSNAYSRAVSTQIASLIYRTQGLQLYRDAIHNLCVDRMNGWVVGKVKKDHPLPQTEPLANLPVIDENSYESLRLHYFNQSVALIQAELNNIKEVGTIKAGETPTLEKAIDSAIKLLNAAKPQAAEEKKSTTTSTTTK